MIPSNRRFYKLLAAGIFVLTFTSDFVTAESPREPVPNNTDIGACDDLTDPRYSSGYGLPVAPCRAKTAYQRLGIWWKEEFSAWPKVWSPALNPKRIRENQPSGWVLLRFRLSRLGRPENIRVHESSPEAHYERAAIEALESWRYEPRYILKNVPWEAAAEQLIVFDPYGTLDYPLTERNWSQP